MQNSRYKENITLTPKDIHKIENKVYILYTSPEHIHKILNNIRQGIK